MKGLLQHAAHDGQRISLWPSGRRRVRAAAASTLALLIACPPPGLWAANAVYPVMTRTGPSGVSTIMVSLPNQIVSGMNLNSANSLAAPSLKGSLSAVPQVSPVNVAPLAQVLPQTLPAVPAAQTPAAVPEQNPAATAQKLGGISHEVMSVLESAGPVVQASAENAQGLGTKVFKSLLEGPADGAGSALASAAQDGQASPASSLNQQKMLHTLYTVASAFAEQYAPIEWKKEQFKLDLKREYDKAKDAIVADPKITTPQLQDLLVSFVAAMRDYHVSISFHSTERARLPFLVTGAEGKYFLAYIDREQLPLAKFPFNIGDEVVSFDDKPTGDAVQELAAKLGGNTAETDMRLAELFLTNRRRSRGDQVPRGKVSFAIRAQDGNTTKMQMPWDYIPEMVRQDVPVRDAGLLAQEIPAEVRPESDIDESLGILQLQASSLKSMLSRVYDQAIHPLASLFAQMREETPENPFLIGTKKSFVPRLGKVLWQTNDKNPFHAYIFETKDGRKAGFIRISSYEGEAAEAKAFGKIMTKFQKETDSLVIDQVNNPGGSVFYLYALASHLTENPLITPRHKLIIGEKDAHEAANVLLRLMQPQSAKDRRSGAKADAKKDEEKTAGGYPITEKFMRLYLNFFKFIFMQFNQLEKRFTDLTYVQAVDEIDPAPKADERYTKPILLLTNALDFSGGDFFPAIMQDNKRVTILGVRTAGAGGMVVPVGIDNQFGIDELHLTKSIAYRPERDPRTGEFKRDPKTQELLYTRPLENLGVTPDIPYDLTEKDLRTGFAEYRFAIIQALQNLMGADPAPAPAPAMPTAKASKTKKN